jgi:CheY-like chemotaxis protein
MNKTVLICDDDQDILDVTRTVLELRGFDVNTVGDCNNIVSVVKDLRPSLILMDLWIPEAGGAAATRMLKAEEHTRDIPVVLFSANNNIEKVAIECGADDFLRKPYDIKDLERKVEQFVNISLSL